MAEEVQIRNSTAQAKVRSPVAVALLSVFTIGIYGIFWWYFINREMKDLGEAHGTEEFGTSPGKSVLALFPGGLIIVPALVSSTAASSACRRPAASSAVRETRRTGGSESSSTSCSRRSSSPTCRAT